MVSDKRREYIAAWQKKNVRQIKFNFNLQTDADILAKLDSLENKQSYIRDLIRADIEKSSKIPCHSDSIPADPKM